MLNRSQARRARQEGVIMIVALIVLVAVTIAAVALTRSVDTATLVAGNLAFKKAATRASDVGIEAAVQVLNTKNIDGTLGADDGTTGYYSRLSTTDSPAAGTAWSAFWSHFPSKNVLLTDAQGNAVEFVIHRECSNAGPAGTGNQCVASPAVVKNTGNSQEAGELVLQSATQIYYRITVKVTGPRRTESYVQTHIAM